MSEASHLTSEERQDLVAYLDGELDAEAARTLEAKLQQSTVARQEAEALQRTWEMLDYLPRPQTPEDFTHRTVEGLEVQRQKTEFRLRRWRWLGTSAWAAGVLAAATLGFLLTYQERPSAEDLRVLKYRTYYEQVDNIEFLHELSQPDLFGEDL